MPEHDSRQNRSSGRYKDIDVLCFDHDNRKDMDAIMASPLWQAARVSGQNHWMQSVSIRIALFPASLPRFLSPSCLLWLYA